MTKTGILQGFIACSAAFGCRFQTPTAPNEFAVMVDLWVEWLSVVGDEEGIAAFMLWCGSKSKPPAPADIIEAAVSILGATMEAELQDWQRYCLSWFDGDGWDVSWRNGMSREEDQALRNAVEEGLLKRDDVIAGKYPCSR
jgi:hypothetical protein